MGSEEKYSANDQLIEGILRDKQWGLTGNNIKTEYLIDSGQDSLVCHISSETWKFYGRGEISIYDKSLTDWFNLVKFYQKTTNKAVNFCRKKGVSFDGFPLIINPATTAFVSSKHETVIGINPFVDPTEKLEENEKSIKFLREVSQILNQGLKVKGIDLMAYNTHKVSGNLVVVDICPHLDNLKNNFWGLK